jgi:hypothetical protein
MVLATAVCLMAVAAGPRRHWPTGTLVDAGRKDTNAIGGAASGARPRVGPGVFSIPTPHGTPEAGTCVIETAELRLELEVMTGDRM